MRGSVLTAALLVWPAGAWAAPGVGTAEDPVVVDELPFFIGGSTVDAASTIQQYDCDPSLDESGGEVLYRFELDATARVAAWVEGDNGTIDVDVHLLEGLDVVDGTAVGCVARGNRIAEATLDAGEHWIAVDTFNGEAQAGSYVLRTYAVGTEWSEIPVGEGVVWRSRRFMDSDGPQVLNVVDLDPSVADVTLEVVDPDGCQTVSQIADAHPVRPVAAVNSSFFSFDGECTSVSFMKHAGEVLAFDAGPALGLTEDLVPSVTTLPADTDWPEVSEAQGGVGMLVEDGVATQGTDAWNAQGLSSASFIGPNPRTFAGYRDDGTLVVGTADGRRPNAFGKSLDALATFTGDELGCEGAVNWDGGGSTTMWVADMTPNGVVNYPSDAGMVEAMDHGGSRSVGGAVLVHANPYNWPPRFFSEPVLDAAAGEAYAYDADAIDLNVEDVIAYSLTSAPDGMAIDEASGEISFAPTAESPPMAEVIVLASDGEGGETEQSFVVTIAGGMGPGDDDGLDESDDDGPGPDDGDEDDDDDDDDGNGGDASAAESSGAGANAADSGSGGCGCGHHSPQPTALLLLTLLGMRRRQSA